MEEERNNKEEKVADGRIEKQREKTSGRWREKKTIKREHEADGTGKRSTWQM